MTEGEKAFYRRQIKDELARARTIDCLESKELHLRWAQFFKSRLDGRRASPPPPLPYQ